MQILVNEDGYILSYATVGSMLDAIEVEDPEEEKLAHFEDHYRAYKYEDGELIFDEGKQEEIDLETLVYNIRLHREKTCFPIINRGGLWYDLLTETEREELLEWYQAWLDAPETLIEPEMPGWLVEMI